MLDAVVCDLDDTLCLTEAACFAMENTALQRIGRPPIPRAAHLRTWGMPIAQAIVERSPGVDVTVFELAYHDVLRERRSDGTVDAIPAANLRTLDALVESGKLVAVVTSRTRPEMEGLLARDHALATRVHRFWYHEPGLPLKPDPRAFDRLLEETGLDPSACVYVGDSVGDAAAATGAGLHFVACLESGIRRREDFRGYPVAAFVDAFAEVGTAVRALEAASSPAAPARPTDPTALE